MCKGLPIPRQGIYQRRYGGPKVPITEEGDCWATAVCSYAGLSVADRNELHRRIVLSDLALRRYGTNPQEGGNWWNVTMRFLREHHCPPLGVIPVKPGPQPEYVYIASGGSPRGDCDHSVLAWGNGNLFWDPHPNKDGLITITEWIAWYASDV